ncbi:Lysophospholipase L1 [Dethiosulfatibacter aminovorans DSM 17477]|uniref:Lysophospholipase L1 n=1 Tax=Dethiosulfatibacter aminovorans DSM 17477 TaxID=1121476 RepID=A0A1M6GF97_9FIRM|nr:GDSL-type esterase/lipase family protein [Dethiosulfatibacter aminovorans]SHJ08632.1 Lysophospholipase L1 [Dethiosulfatibacter aminovorans DSM 17477]
MKKTRLVIILIIITMLALPVNAFANHEEGIVYTALGDSIAAGTGSANGDSYTDMFNEYLRKLYKDKVYNDKVVYNNFASDGTTSGALVMDLTNPLDPDFYATFNAVISSNVITISIGGNDVLDYIEQFDPEIEYSEEDFNAIAYYIETNIVPQMFSNFTDIISAIKTTNPTAQIYVNNFYNPFVYDEELHNFAELFIPDINTALKDGEISLIYGRLYYVVDVYTAFDGYRNPKSLVNYDYSLETKDAYLHPRHKGYKVMTNVLKDLYEENQ